MKKLYFTGIVTLSLIISIGLFSCKTGKKTTTSTNTTSTTTTSSTTPAVVYTYTASAQNIISARCSGCHGYGSRIDMTTYASVKKYVDNGEFKETVITDRSMPKGGSLSPEDYNIIKSWLEAGAPE